MAASIASNTSSRPWVAAPRSSITTTTAGSTFSFSAARGWTALPQEPPTGCTRTIATARSPMSPKKPGCGARAGPRRCAWATTTTMASTICSSPTGGRTSCTATTATARSPMSPKQAGLLHPRRRWGSGCTFVDYNRDGHLDLFVANYLDFDLESVPKPGRERQLQLERHAGELRAAGPAARFAASLPQQRRRHVHRRERAHPASQRQPAVTA